MGKRFLIGRRKSCSLDMDSHEYNYFDGGFMIEIETIESIFQGKNGNSYIQTSDSEIPIECLDKFEDIVKQINDAQHECKIEGGNNNG